LPGQFYLPHFDAFDVTTGPGRECVATGGQRVATVLIYLNTLPAGVGGETRFPRLGGGGDDAAAAAAPPSAAARGGLAFRPEQGTALVFFPCTLDAQLDPQALHAAEPITAAAETKYVAQIWIRQGVFCAPPAPPAAPAPMAGDDF
jgi:prolyl 4-hydroxylase